MTAPGRPPAVTYLAMPGSRHPASDRISPEVLAELEDLHQRCLPHVGPRIDAGAALLDVTADGRVRFAGGGGSTAMLDSDLVDAVVHAARAGYRLCLRRDWPNGSGVPRHPCWLPASHVGDCERRGWWRWSLLYGQRRPVTVVCTTCTPHRHVPAPDTCPHQ